MLKIGTLTTLGNDYRNLGNPEGYILPNLMGEIEPSIEDEYVDDYVNVMINGRSENVVLGSKFDKIDTLMSNTLKNIKNRNLRWNIICLW